MSKKKVKYVIIEVPEEDYEWFVDKFDIVFDPTVYILNGVGELIMKGEERKNEQKETE